MRFLSFFLKKIIKICAPWSKEYIYFCSTGQQGSYKEFLKFKFGLQKKYWPSSGSCLLANSHSIYVGKNCLIGRPGVYIQGKAGVYIGNYVQFGPNVGVLSSSHDLYDQRKSNDKSVVIGNYCWLGMNSVVLPGVKLGTRTVVAAGSVVTKSFEEGYCVVAGVPAKIVRKLDEKKFKPWREEREFYGFVTEKEFESKYPDIVSALIRNIDT